MFSFLITLSVFMYLFWLCWVFVLRGWAFIQVCDAASLYFSSFLLRRHGPDGPGSCGARALGARPSAATEHRGAWPSAAAEHRLQGTRPSAAADRPWALQLRARVHGRGSCRPQAPGSWPSAGCGPRAPALGLQQLRTTGLLGARPSAAAQHRVQGRSCGPQAPGQPQQLRTMGSVGLLAFGSCGLRASRLMAFGSCDHGLQAPGLGSCSTGLVVVAPGSGAAPQP